MELFWCPARKTNARTNLSRDVCSSPPPTNGALKPGGSCWSNLANPRLVKHGVMFEKSASNPPFTIAKNYRAGNTGVAAYFCRNFSTSENMAHNTHTPPKICSQNCDQRSYIRFCNTTERSVKVFWVNYEGKYVLYRVLPPCTHFDTDSFVTHPWVFVDAVTQERLVVNQEEVFYPQPMIMRSDNRTYRNCIFITLPLYSLKEIALQVVRNNIVRREGVYRLVHIEDVYRLEIPVVLQKELIAAIHKSAAVFEAFQVMTKIPQVQWSLVNSTLNTRTCTQFLAPVVTIQDQQRIIKEVEKNPSKKRNTGKVSTYSGLETVRFTWYQQDKASGISVGEIPQNSCTNGE
uniref:von Hippel-Lindau disease tumour suppressor beta domain-containing protein n=1 Tax=Timema tahoe TaxID=61484 RepID=A0A7R9FK61_9NEOP|nr:unnamed protein product [Timema tahoe]